MVILASRFLNPYNHVYHDYDQKKFEIHAYNRHSTKLSQVYITPQKTTCMHTTDTASFLQGKQVCSRFRKEAGPLLIDNNIIACGTEVAGIAKYFLARTVRVGYREQFFLHHRRGCSSTGSSSMYRLQLCGALVRILSQQQPLCAALLELHKYAF